MQMTSVISASECTFTDQTKDYYHAHVAVVVISVCTVYSPFPVDVLYRPRSVYPYLVFHFILNSSL